MLKCNSSSVQLLTNVFKLSAIIGGIVLLQKQHNKKCFGYLYAPPVAFSQTLFTV